MKNNWWTVSRLLQVPGVNITARDNRGATPAYWAVANNSIECLAVLARDLTVDWWNYRSISGKTPLYVAIFHGHVEIVKILLQIQDQDFYVKTDDFGKLVVCSQFVTRLFAKLTHLQSFKEFLFYLLLF